MNLIDNILDELQNRLESGKVDLSDEFQLKLLVKILKENKWPDTAIKQFIKNILILNEDDIVKNKKSKNTYSVKSHNPKTQDLIKKDASPEEIEKIDVSKKSKKEPIEKEIDLTDIPKQEKQEKQKEIKQQDSLKTKSFTENIDPDDSIFNKKNKNNLVKPPLYKLPSNIKNNPKFPKKYIKLLERMINTKKSNDTKKLSYFINAGGAGTIDSQLGELLTMIGSTLDDNDAEEFYSSLDTFGKDRNDKELIYSNSWVNSARKNRKAVLDCVRAQYGENTKLIVGCWDTEEEVEEGMGLNNYKKNKGFSTDVYFKVDDGGKQKLLEISLKKSLQIFLFNGSTGALEAAVPNLSDNLKATEYTKNQTQRLDSAYSKNENNIKKIIKTNPKLANEIMDKMGYKDINELITNFTSNNAKDKRKAILTGMKILAESGNKDANTFVKKHLDAEKQFSSDWMDEISKNPEAKGALLIILKENLPLNSIATGEEAMVLEDIGFHKKMFKKIFGTDNFDEVSEHLSIDSSTTPPSLIYKIKGTGEIIPIATVGIRSKGLGYSGNPGLEIKFHPTFKKILKAENTEING